MLYVLSKNLTFKFTFHQIMANYWKLFQFVLNAKLILRKANK
jgi:hypothetical protein